MIRFLAGVVAAVLLTTAGLLWWNNRAADRHLPAAPPADGPAMFGKETGDSPPAASDESREQRRFARYDKDEDGKVSRDEYLAARRRNYDKLDTNHDGRLDFDEYATRAIVKFASADQDKSAGLNPTEFATTAVKRKSNPTAPCPPAAPRDDD
jgi:hypothetical protein